MESALDYAIRTIEIYGAMAERAKTATIH